MKRFIVSVLVAVALLTSSVMISQNNLMGVAYAEDGDGGE